MSLLDPSTTYYVMSEGVWKRGNGDILDQAGVKIGSTKCTLLPMRTRIELKNPDDTILCTIDTKTVNSRPTYDVKDSGGKLVGRAKRAMLALKGSMRMYGPNDNELYKAEGDVTKRSFIITDSKNRDRVYATIAKTDRWRSVFLPNLKLGNEYVIRIEDLEADRLIVLAYAVIIDKAYHGK